MENNIKITQLNPEDFKPQQYNIQDSELIISNFINTNFNPDTDYIENYVLDSNLKIIFPFSGDSVSIFTQYNIDEDKILLNPVKDLERLLFDNGEYIIGYNFYRKWVGSSPTQKYFISEISSDRTEIRLDSNDINIEDIIPQIEEFIEYRNSQPHFVDFYLNFGRNKKSIANNISIDNTTTTPTLLIKLYEPLPEEFDLKSTLWVVEEINFPQVYEVSFPFSFEITEDITPISGPNFNLKVKTQNNQTTEEISFNGLFNQDFNSTSKLKNLLNKKGISININYEDFSSFVHFSSLKTRLENFLSKIQLLEKLDNNVIQLEQQNNNTVLNNDISLLKKKKENIIENFDGYETFLYYNTTSNTSYPKDSNNELYPLNSNEVNNWLNTLVPQIEIFDNNNQNQLKNTIPQYLREDPENKNYELFIDMVSQHYDTIWVYIKSITNKFDNDNRLDFGISKDLVEEALKEFGVKLYSNNFDVNDLYASFLGINQNGGILPYKNITGSLPADTGDEYVDNLIVSNTSSIALDDYSSRVKKRIYHNLPYLLKSKGTISGLRALITSYGIPDTILRINEFGGKSKDNLENKDYFQNIFNYKLNINENNEGVKVPILGISPNFGGDTPKTIIFRYKNEENNIQNIEQSQILLSINDTSDEIISALILEYTPPSPSPTHQGDIITEDKFLTKIKFIPDYNNLSNFVDIDLPIMDGEWWSFYLGIDGNNITLKVGNSQNNKLKYFIEAQDNINNNISANRDYILLSGEKLSLQELRYYNIALNNQPFINYILNPLSIEGNALNSTPEELIFRADLGSTLNTSSFESIHPKSTGSLSYITSSFTTGNGFEVVGNPTFKPNYEEINYTTLLSGINNTISSNIVVEDLEFPNSPSGSNSDNIVLSPHKSIRQDNLGDNNYTQNVNYLEVAFSPTDQINDDISSQLGGIDLGEFLGDPKQYFNKDTSYKTLDVLRNEYFKKFIKSTDIKDFIRLIKFFDNSLFKIIEDFTPTRTSLSSGVVIKQHLLERNKYPQPVGSFSNETLETDIKNKQRDIFYDYKGGTGGVFDIYNGLETSPSASILGLNNKFNLTQSFEEEVKNLNGILSITNFSQKEFYNGEFDGSNIKVSQQDINRNCAPYKKFPTTPIQFFPFLFSTNFSKFQNGTVKREDWIQPNNEPLNQQIWVLTSTTLIPQGFLLTNLYNITDLKISRQNINGDDITNFILDAEFLELKFNGKNFLLYINSVQVNPNHILLNIDNTQGNFTFVDGDLINRNTLPERGSYNYSFLGLGNYKVLKDNGTLSPIDPNSQNIFNFGINNQTQFIQFYNSFVNNSLFISNVGSANDIENQEYIALEIEVDGTLRNGDRPFTDFFFIEKNDTYDFFPLPLNIFLDGEYFDTTGIITNYNQGNGSTLTSTLKGNPVLKENGEVTLNFVLNEFKYRQNRVQLFNPISGRFTNQTSWSAISNAFRLTISIKYKRNGNIFPLYAFIKNFNLETINNDYTIPLNINTSITHPNAQAGDMYFIEYKIETLSSFPSQFRVELSIGDNLPSLNINQSLIFNEPTLSNPLLGTIQLPFTPNTPLRFNYSFNYRAEHDEQFINSNENGLYHFDPIGNVFISSHINEVPSSPQFFHPIASPLGGNDGGLNPVAFDLTNNNGTLAGNIFNQNGEYGNPPLKINFEEVNLSFKDFGISYDINYPPLNQIWIPISGSNTNINNLDISGNINTSPPLPSNLFRYVGEEKDGAIIINLNNYDPSALNEASIKIQLRVRADINTLDGEGIRIASTIFDNGSPVGDLNNINVYDPQISYDFIPNNYSLNNLASFFSQKLFSTDNSNLVIAEIDLTLDNIGSIWEDISNRFNKVLVFRPEIFTNISIDYFIETYDIQISEPPTDLVFNPNP